MQPILYTIYETSADFKDEEASMAKADIIEFIEKDPDFEFARKLENTKTKAELVSEHSLKTMAIMDIVEQHEIKAELTVVCNEIEAETGSGETQVELTKQIDIEAELSNKIHYVQIATDSVVANMEIGGNDEQPGLDIGLGSVPEYTK